jgi:Bacterial PH domain
MSDGATGWLLRFLRVPPEPHLPAGEPRSARVFRAGARYWTLKLLGWSIRQGFTLAGFLFIAATLHLAPASVSFPQQKGPFPPVPLAGPMVVMRTLETVAFGIWLLQLPITLAILRLDYELRWYIVTDRAARLREGILGLREMTLTLANVQDVRIQQGPLQRLLGLADVELRTAGGGEAPAGHAGAGAAGANDLHLARFRGVDNAEAIRDLVVDRMKRARGAGLGDPDDAPPAAPDSGTSTDLLAAARELAIEAALLRAAVHAAGPLPSPAGRRPAS